MAQLKHTYNRVLYHGGPSYGGNQDWLFDKTMKKYGCGVIAGADLLLYLGLHRPGCQTRLLSQLKFQRSAIQEKEYLKYIEIMRKRYFPVLPGFGMPGWLVSLGLNRYFRQHHIDLRARWGVFSWKLEKSIEEMLEKDIPVILAVGPNFPFMWGKETLFFHALDQKGNPVGKTAVKAHYVIATAKDGDRVHISSWGREYEISWEEYRTYVKNHSCYFYSNICYITQRRSR